MQFFPGTKNQATLSLAVFRNQNLNMKSLEKCPVCGGGLENQQIEKRLGRGENAISMTVSADVCTGCGEKLSSEAVVKSFEAVRAELKKTAACHFDTIVA